MSLRFLVVEGNTRAVRESYRAGQGLTPAEGFGRALTDIAGGGSVTILHAADADGALPKGMQIADFDAAVITGSSLHLWQQAPEAMRQVEAARAIFAAKIPFFGSCWGLQVAAVAAGGAVSANPRGREMGFARKITPSAAAHPLLDGRPAVFDAPCSHLDEVSTLPPGAILLASNAMSEVQAAEIRYSGGTFWGVQYHPEYRLSDLAFLIERRVATLTEEGLFADAAEGAAYCADLRALDADPGRRGIAWRHGLGPDVIDPFHRVTELRNFIEARARPHALARAA